MRRLNNSRVYAGSRMRVREDDADDDADDGRRSLLVVRAYKKRLHFVAKFYGSSMTLFRSATSVLDNPAAFLTLEVLSLFLTFFRSFVRSCVLSRCRSPQSLFLFLFRFSHAPRSIPLSSFRLAKMHPRAHSRDTFSTGRSR